MLHGEPTWRYLYQHMIGPLVDAGYRAVVPDLIGFGRSDKPLDRAAYSYASQVARMRAWIEALDLRNMILACQARSEEHKSELQSLMRISYAVFCLTKQKLK